MAEAGGRIASSGPGVRHRASGKARGINDDIDLLRALDLEDLRDGPATFCGRFPMDLVEAVARDVVAQLLELTAFADLPLRVEAERAAMEKQRRQVPPLGE